MSPEAVKYSWPPTAVQDLSGNFARKVVPPEI